MRPYVPAPGTAVRPPDLAPALCLAVSGRTGSRTGTRGCGRRSRPGELPLLVVAAILLTFVIKTLLIQAFYIPSESMVPTLHEQDRVLVEKLSYRFRDPQRGEIIVFHRPGNREPMGGWAPGRLLREFLAGLGLAQPPGEVDFIKRIIGLPGDTVEVRHGTVLINGRPLQEPYAEPETRDSPRVVVPPGRYFMMGDNRTNSLDSRFGLGFVSRTDIVGHAFVVLWPPGSARVSLDQHYPGVAR
jgi:signal peptidase I